ncbi:MAG TPA: hypothetical protein VGJ03_00715 [Acidimicrobiales bacterium]
MRSTDSERVAVRHVAWVSSRVADRQEGGAPSGNVAVIDAGVGLPFERRAEWAAMGPEPRG